MKKLLTIIMTTLTIIASGQVDPAIWDSLKTINTDNYEISFPYKWRQTPTTTGQGPEQMLEGSGLALPATFKGSPVIVTIFMVKQNAKSLEDAKDKCSSGYRDNSDREFPKKIEDGEEKIKLASGDDAYLLNTRFYRKSKGLNQSRYDLVCYSEKAKAGYIYTLSIQYADDEYNFETENQLADFAKKLFSYVNIKN